MSGQRRRRLEHRGEQRLGRRFEDRRDWRRDQRLEQRRDGCLLVARKLAWAAACAAWVAAVPGPSNAQDFSAAEPGGPALTAAGLLDRGLLAQGGSHVEALTTSWLGVPGLVTRGLCATARFNTVCAAAGWSLTGEPEVGWMSAAVAVGAVSSRGGVAVRGLVRRDLDPLATRGEGRSAEVGGGAWLRAGTGIVVWARAPQLATFGLAPPLARALTVGLAAERDGLGAWFEREAPARRSDESGTHAGGVSIAVAQGRVWVEGRGRPLRAGFGISLGVIAVRALGHPRLGDTVTITVTLPPQRSHG